MKKVLVILLATVMLLPLCACGNSGSGDDTTPTACEHNYVGKTTQEASVFSAGFITYTCSKCGDSYTQTIQKKAVNVGDVITYGVYEQDNSTSNGKEPIEWIVLDKEKDSLLLISKYALDAIQFNRSEIGIWSNSSLREWLNDSFLRASFDPTERGRIKSTEVVTDGQKTTDSVFLLSKQEVTSYFSSKNAQSCEGTAYCYAAGAIKTSKGICQNWWLRDRGGFTGTVSTVMDSGIVASVDARAEFVAVRPAITISTN